MSYLSIITYVLFALLAIFGIKFAGFSKFNDDFMSLNKTKALRGIAAVGVILHHISQQQIFQKTNTLSFFREIGIYFVAIFFFCSGYGLIKSFMTKENYFKGFIKNRILKTLVVPFYINTILYVLVFFFVLKFQYPLAQWICGALGIFMINDYAWFPIVLTLLYFAFYFIYKNIKNRKVCNLIMFFVIVFFCAWFCVGGHMAWWAGEKNWFLSPSGWKNSQWWMGIKVLWFSGEWWVNVCIAFLMGILFGQNEEKVVTWFKKNYWIKLLIVAIIFVASYMLSEFARSKIGYWTEWSGKGPGILNKTITLILQQPSIIFFIILLFALMMKVNSENIVTRFFGNYSLETYLMNYMAICLFWNMIYKPGTDQPLYVAGNVNAIKYEIFVFICTIVLGLIYSFICKGVKKLIK